jgi:hypothetical protein
MDQTEEEVEIFRYWIDTRFNKLFVQDESE